jgi:hypothetical protein
MNTGERKAGEASGSILTPIGSEFLLIQIE